MPATVADVARRVAVSPSTIRNWSNEFEPFLSTSAAPPAGSDRIYQDDDIAVLATIAAMRQERQPFETIRAALAAGERIRPPEEEQPAGDAGQESGQQSALVTRLMANVAKFEGELQATKEERDYLRVKLEEERAARLAAEIRAAKAETLPSIQSAAAPPESPATPAPGQEESPPAEDAAPLTWRKRFGRWVAGQ